MPLTLPSSASNQTVRALVHWAQANELPVEGVLRTAGVDAAQLEDPWGRLQPEQVAAVFDGLNRRYAQNDLAMIAADADNIEPYDLVGLAMFSQRTAMDTIQSGASFFNLMMGMGRAHMWVEGDRAYAQLNGLPTTSPGADQFVTFILSQLLATVRMTGGGLDFSCQAWLPQRRPRSMALFDELFGDKVRFEQTNALLCFPAEALEALNPGFNGMLLNAVMPTMQQKLSLGAQVRPASMRAMLELRDLLLAGHEPRLEAVARRMECSPRTLQFYLGQENRRFSDCLEQVRRENALLLLSLPQRSLDDIAADLGFGDISSLHRFTQRWYGNSPGALRGGLDGGMDAGD